MSSTSLPSLLGDGNGCYKVRIVGNSGTGKTTLGTTLAEVLGVPFIALDTLHFEPGWKEASVEGFQTKVRAVLVECDRGWVMDGNYESWGGAMITNECTDIIWLDPPFLLYFSRIFVRTMLRLVGRSPPCSPGCQEKLGSVFFSKDSILWWCMSHHWAVRRRYQELLTKLEVDRDKRMRRLGGWGQEQRKWLKEVRDMCRET